MIVDRLPILVFVAAVTVWIAVYKNLQNIEVVDMAAYHPGQIALIAGVAIRFAKG